MTGAGYTRHSGFFSSVIWGRAFHISPGCGLKQRAVHCVCQHTDKPLKPQQKRSVLRMYLHSLVLVHFIWLLWNTNSPRATRKGDRLVHLGNHVDACVQESSWYRVKQSYIFLPGLKVGGSCYEYQMWHQVFLCKTSHQSWSHLSTLSWQTDLHLLGLSGFILNHVNSEDRRCRSLTCKEISALLWTILVF